MKYTNTIVFRLVGQFALFTDPVIRSGGEKSSLPIPTYQALKGICESIYWKPTICWVVDRVRIMKPIQTESKGIRPVKYSGGNDLAYYTYLRDVEYLIEAHFEFNLNRLELEQDRDENKHYFIAKRCLEKGGRRDIFLGTRECQGYVYPSSFDQKGYYKDTDLEFGFQYHSISYPDENGKGVMLAKFWYPKMVKGVIEFCRPEECPKEREIRKMSYKTFKPGKNFSGLEEDEILSGYGVPGGEMN